jgi:Inner membrane component of T3SS, cytoplasmic domain
MAKFTIYFKEKVIHAGVFDSGVVHIGRDESCDLVVDSLAVAPAHAVAVFKDTGCVIKELNDKFPLLINNRPMKECTLQNNDVINIGKHTIVFNTQSAVNAAASSEATKSQDASTLNGLLPEKVKMPEAGLQVMNGDHIGRILPLKKAMTRLGREGSGIVVIAHRKEGYFISALQEHDSLVVNHQPLGDRIVKLHHADVVVVDKVPMQFFLDNV